MSNYKKYKENHLKAQKSMMIKIEIKSTNMIKKIIEQLKDYVLENSYLDLAGSRCWVNKHSAEKIMNILKSKGE